MKNRLNKKVGKKCRRSKKTLDTKIGGGNKTLDIKNKNDGGNIKEIKTLDTNNSGGSRKKNNDNKNEKKIKQAKNEMVPPGRKPSEKEKRSMFGKSLEIMLVAAMTNHVYLFNNKIRKQSQGGPIGLKLTGEIADCVMIDWDKKLKRLLEEFEIFPLLYSRFKDDIALALKRIMKGSKLVDGKLIIDDQKQKEDENKTDEIVTMEIIQEIANGIDPMIKVTIDTPCNYEDRQLPILDVKVRVNQEVENRIDFEFFEKPTKNPKVILADSALSSSSKRTILTQECLRRLRNTKLEIGKEIQNNT